jgi:hypothetical protein
MCQVLFTVDLRHRLVLLRFIGSFVQNGTYKKKDTFRRPFTSILEVTVSKKCFAIMDKILSVMVQQINFSNGVFIKNVNVSSLVIIS